MKKYIKVLSLFLALVMVLSLCACSAKTDDSADTTTAADVTESGDVADDTTTASANNAEAAKLTGKINIINPDDKDSAILRGVRIGGLSVGSAEGFNNKEASLDDVRCIFELGEWIEFYPDTDAEYALRVWILKHRDDQEYYNDCEFSDLMPGFAQYCDLHYPVDEENPDSWYWGSFYLNQDECEPGYYDFVFTYEGKAIGVLQTRFYNAGELSGKSDEELEALMHE